MNTKLKIESSCPFCGGRAVLRRGNVNKHGYFVICRSCGASTSFFSDKYTSREENAKQAIQAWERRFNNDR